VSDVGCKNHIRYLMGYQTLATEIDARSIGFLGKQRVSNNSVMHLLYDAFGHAKL